MKLRKLFIIVLLNFLVLTACKDSSRIFVPSNNNSIVYEGRIEQTDSLAKKIFWSGTSIKLRFEGAEVSAVIKDERGDNYYNVILDSDSIFVLRPDSIKTTYKLAENLDEGVHTIELYKRTEWDRGHTVFYGFELPKKSKVLDSENVKTRKIEFFGNSITAGYAIEDYSENDSPDSIFTNNYLTYAALTARHFNAKAHYTVKSGIGIMISWFPQIMPEIFNRINPYDENSVWDFNKFTPDVVIINLFQNDSWLVNKPDHEEFKSRFAKKAPEKNFIIKSYKNFVSTIRATYPNTQIICMLGTMDITREGSAWPGYVQKAVDQLNDNKIFTLFVPFKDTPGHPRVEEQKVMADSLISFIDKNIEW